MRPLPRGFSLLEVAVALVIFSVGMVAVLGLLAPVAKTAATVSDAEAAARAAAAVRARLQALGFEQALALVQETADIRKKDADGAYNLNDPAKAGKVLFGKLSGDIGLYDAARTPRGWYDSAVPAPRLVADAEKFFEIDLIRNDPISPASADATAAFVAFNIRVRWPAFRAAPGGAAVQVGSNPAGGGPVPFDHGKKQAMVFSGAILR